MKVIKRIGIFVFSATLALLTALAPAVTSFAASGTPVGENTAWIRAKLTWQHDAGVSGLDDSLIEFSNDGWTKSDGWYYYNIPVNPGDKVRFINGVRVPHDWDNKTVDKNFRLIVTVEAGEVAPGDTGWNKNTETVFSQDFVAWSQGYKTDEDVWVEEGKLAVRINEYQISENGDLETYVNDKVIIPGQFISKIVEIEIDGTKGANVKLIPEPPVKRVYAGDVEVDGKIVDRGTALRYEISVKNPAPDKRKITVYDTVDSRLKVVDTGGAEMQTSGKTTKLTWTVEVEGKWEGKVSFTAVAAENISEDEGQAIPNNAEADIVGKRLKSNTVVVGLGPVSQLKMAVTRATGDWGVLGIAAFGIGIVSVIALVIVLIWKKSKHRGEADYEED